MEKYGSQNREKLEDSGYVVERLFDDGSAFLKDVCTGEIELWQQNDHFAGYVIEINGKGYEFVSSTWIMGE